jgi:hypothetical protein
MGDAQHLGRLAQPAKLLPHHRGGAAADAGVDFVEDQRAPRLVAGAEGLERQHHPRQLATRGDAGQRLGRLSEVGREEELAVVDAAGVPARPVLLGGEPQFEAGPGHRQVRQLSLDGGGEPGSGVPAGA